MWRSRRRRSGAPRGCRAEGRVCKGGTKGAQRRHAIRENGIPGKGELKRRQYGDWRSREKQIQRQTPPTEKRPRKPRATVAAT
jgi:hypothetical protein